jgi:hypothetical protein
VFLLLKQRIVLLLEICDAKVANKKNMSHPPKWGKVTRRLLKIGKLK